MSFDQLLIEADPQYGVSTPQGDSAEAQAILRHILGSTTRAPRRAKRTRRRLALACGVVVVVAALTIGALPDSPTRAPAASAAPFLRAAAKGVMTTATFGGASPVVPLASQYVYSETEDPSGTLQKEWLSVDGLRPEVERWISGIPGEVPASGGAVNTACSIAQAQATGCFPEAGYLPNMPTDPSALIAYFNSIALTDISTTSNPDPSDPTGWLDNDLSGTITFLMSMTYLEPAQQAAIFELMAQTPGFTIVPNMADAIGRIGTGVEWNFQGDAGALIFNPTTYALLGERTWPGPPVLSAPYDGDALLGITLVNSIPPS
jgi:hypothetical protein